VGFSQVGGANKSYRNPDAHTRAWNVNLEKKK